MGLSSKNCAKRREKQEVTFATCLCLRYQPCAWLDTLMAVTVVCRIASQLDAAFQLSELHWRWSLDSVQPQGLPRLLSMYAGSRAAQSRLKPGNSTQQNCCFPHGHGNSCLMAFWATSVRRTDVGEVACICGALPCHSLRPISWAYTMAALR